jgi:glucan phosphoethanolaminetransferase (alkaline phosphatase superfamily)
MLQRVQSILLVLIALLALACLFLPYYTKVDSTGLVQVEFNAWSITQTQLRDTLVMRQQWVIWVGVCFIAAAALAIYNMLQYTNRMRQLQLGVGLSLLLAGGMLGIIFISRSANDWINPRALGTQNVGFYLPMAALVLNMMANRLIRRDEKLVRSADRIR